MTLAAGFCVAVGIIVAVSTFKLSNGAEDITPIPVEHLNPRLTEFRRVDSNADDHLTFSEFLLGDRPYIESQSRKFHKLDANGDGRVSRAEYENFNRRRGDSGSGSGDSGEIRLRHARILHDNFVKQLGPTEEPPLLLTTRLTVRESEDGRDSMLSYALYYAWGDRPNKSSSSTSAPSPPLRRPSPSPTASPVAAV